MRPRVNPTIFDKLVSYTEIAGLQDDSPATEVTRESLQRFTVARIERFNEDAQRAKPPRDKSVSATDVSEPKDNGPAAEVAREKLPRFTAKQIERFSEDALRGTIRRDLGWLFNTTNLASVFDLEHYPNIRTSVLNYGIPAMSGRAVTQRAVQQRAREIRSAILNFEPRFEADSLTVESAEGRERENSITFVINGDVTSAVNALPMTLKTDVDIDSAAVTVRD